MTDLTRRFYNTQVLGDVLVAEAFVHVRWIWVTLPLLLLSTSLLILSVTIYQTMRSKIALWKLSSLPLLYHGPDHMAARSDLASSPSLDKVSGMELDAEHVFVRLARAKGTAAWELQEQ